MSKQLIMLWLVVLSNIVNGQHENDNWTVGNSTLNFNSTNSNGFSQTIRQSPYIRYSSSVISDKITGELLFYSDGYKVYNKNNAIMDNGDDLFGANNQYFNVAGNPSDQSSIILPLPGSQSIYYIFYINGDRRYNDQALLFNNVSYNYGLRYAIVDISLNNGLGKVITKNNILFLNNSINALSSTYSSDGAYWVISNDGRNFLSYKLTSQGLQPGFVSSPGLCGNFIKISPDAKKLATRTPGLLLYDFDYQTGKLSNPINVLDAAPANLRAYYNDDSNSPNSLEFSPDSNIIYFACSVSCLCLYPNPLISKAGLSAYNIVTGQFAGVDQSQQYSYPLSTSASMQLGPNGKVYLMQNRKLQNDGYGLYEVDISDKFYVINSPNIFPSSNPIAALQSSPNTKNGFSFPQLIPPVQNSNNNCPTDIVLSLPETHPAYSYQAHNSIVAKDNYMIDGQSIMFKAGSFILLESNTSIKPQNSSLFLAKIEKCTKTTDLKSLQRAAYNVPLIREKVDGNIVFYPNPVITELFIKSSESVIEWQIYDMNGRTVKSGNTSPINLVELPKGVYIILVKTNRHSQSKRIIKL